MRAAIYLRLSVETDASTSPRRQREECEKFVAKQGWKYDPATDCFEDLGRSAYSKRVRPAFEEMRRRVAAGEYGVVVVHRLDRLSRDWKTWANMLDDESPVTFYSATEGLDSQTNRFTIGILSLVAEQESRNTSARVKSARSALFAQGRWPGGNRPFGWRPAPHPSGQGLVLEIHPEERALLREAVDRLLEGHSAASVVAAWNARGITTTQGRAWWQASLSRLLRSPLLQGYRVEGGQPVVGEDGMPVQLWDPLVSREEWAQLQARLGKRTSARPREKSSLLAGLVRCAECGGGMTGPAHPQLLSDTYRCPSHQARGGTVCPGVSISALRLNELITKIGLELVHPSRLSEPEPTPQVDLEAERIAALREGLQRLENMYLLGEFKDADGERRYLHHRANLKQELEERLRNAGPEVEPTHSAEVMWDLMDGQVHLFNQEGLTKAGALLERFASLNRVHQREVLAAGIESIHIAKFRGTQRGVPRAKRDVCGRITVKPRDPSFEGRSLPFGELKYELFVGAAPAPLERDDPDYWSWEDEEYARSVLTGLPWHRSDQPWEDESEGTEVMYQGR